MDKTASNLQVQVCYAKAGDCAAARCQCAAWYHLAGGHRAKRDTTRYAGNRHIDLPCWYLRQTQDFGDNSQGRRPDRDLSAADCRPERVAPTACR